MHSCGECGRGFKSKRALTAHKNEKHRGEQGGGAGQQPPTGGSTAGLAGGRRGKKRGGGIACRICQAPFSTREER